MAKSVDTKPKEKPQDFTSKIPMVDLEESVNLVTEIRDKALETAPMPDVALAFGYKSSTSSPFYKRITAARLFNLLSAKSSLSQEAIDYIRPHDEGTRARVLAGAIRGIPIYTELLAKYVGKKLNVDLVANAIAKDCNLSDGCASICAKAFEASIRFAGMISSDGSVSISPESNAASAPNMPPAGEVANPAKSENGPKEPPIDANLPTGTQHHVLYLDRDKSRSFTFTGPLEITRAEYDRICKWLEFTMLISEEKKETMP